MLFAFGHLPLGFPLQKSSSLLLTTYDVQWNISLIIMDTMFLMKLRFIWNKTVIDFHIIFFIPPLFYWLTRFPVTLFCNGDFQNCPRTL